MAKKYAINASKDSKDRLTAVKSLTPRLYEIKKCSIVHINYRQDKIPENFCPVIAQTARMSKRYRKNVFKIFFRPACCLGGDRYSDDLKSLLRLNA